MYNINEEEPATIVHVFSDDDFVKKQPVVSGFDTIVKVDKKTEEKLVKSSSTFDGIVAQNNIDVSMSAKKLVYGA